MLYRTASVLYGRALAYAMLGNITDAKKEAALFDLIRQDPDCENRILHNNTVSDLLQLDSVMMHGEILYRCGQYNDGLDLLKEAVTLQDNLNYDEPWGKMQPIRHAYGGLLLERNRIDEAINVFQTDLRFHPNNPWSLIGLISCCKQKSIQLSSKTESCCCIGSLSVNDGESTRNNNHQKISDAKSPPSQPNSSCYGKDNFESAKKENYDSIPLIEKEIVRLEEQYQTQRQNPYADFAIEVPCECCKKNVGNKI
jgi:tetratricopeptide (TPR) repeat protein